MAETAAETEAVIAAVRTHHAAMSDTLAGHTEAVARAADDRQRAAALSALVAYLRGEVLVHAAAEESTIYAAAAPLAPSLVEALELEHRDLAEQVQGLARTAAGATPPAALPLAMAAAAVLAVFRVHAAKENDVVLPLVAAAGQPLRPLLGEMERAFAAGLAAAASA